MDDQKNENGQFGRSPQQETKGVKFVKKKPSKVDIQALAENIRAGDRVSLARGITLAESSAAAHFKMAQDLLEILMPHTGKAIRIGISGVPGAGKSTFIEAFGSFLCSKGHRVAVLAVDPSSSRSGGSILGDKTRMEMLSSNPRAFIRPSPTGGQLGGVHRKTREAMLMCESAGYDVILVETVGVGQSEVIVREMVDFFLLLVLTGAGDDLQGMKKGIIELTDAIIVNKADGDNAPLAEKTRIEYERILHFLQPATSGWQTRALACSSVKRSGIPEIWEMIKDFRAITGQSGVFESRRRDQTREWVHSLIIEQLESSFFRNPEVKRLLPQIEKDVIAGNRPAAAAVEELFAIFNRK